MEYERGNTMIIIHAIFQVDPAKQQSFLEEIQPLIHGSREESGNVSYDLYKDTEKESVYTMVEAWKDEAKRLRAIIRVNTSHLSLVKQHNF